MARWETEDMWASHRDALADLAAAYATTGTQPPPARTADDGPAGWECRPDHLAPHRCGCGARFHVRRHRDAHEHTCPYGRI